MTRPDLNLLTVLDVLLTEGSVARAAQRLHLSPSAMSRALSRLRAVTGDPLLVRAGRGLVPTQRARELRPRTRELVHAVRDLLRPAGALNLAQLVRTFTLGTREGFVETFGGGLLTRVGADAPGVQLVFRQKLSKEGASLRDGTVDLETGVVSAAMSPELRARALFRDRLVGVVRDGHPLSRGRVTAQRFAAARHVSVSRRGRARGPVDDALAAAGLDREVVAVVGGYSGALALARDADLVATVPERHTAGLRTGMYSFPLPLTLPGLTVSMLWHPRMDADPGHRWLRECLRDVCAAPLRRSR